MAPRYVQLAPRSRHGVFHDFESNWRIARDEIKLLPEKLGVRTKACLNSGGLVFVDPPSVEGPPSPQAPLPTVSEEPVVSNQKTQDEGEPVPSVDVSREERIQQMKDACSMRELREKCKILGIKQPRGASAEVLAGLLVDEYS